MSKQIAKIKATRVSFGELVYFILGLQEAGWVVASSISSPEIEDGCKVVYLTRKAVADNWIYNLRGGHLDKTILLDGELTKAKEKMWQHAL